MRRAERVALAWRRASLADRGVEAGQGVRALGGLPCVYKYPCTGVFWFEPSGIGEANIQAVRRPERSSLCLVCSCDRSSILGSNNQCLLDPILHVGRCNFFIFSFYCMYVECAALRDSSS